MTQQERGPSTMTECQCDPDVWGPDGLEQGTGHNPVCPNYRPPSNLDDAIGDASYLHHWAMKGRRSPEVIAALDESLGRVTAVLLAVRSLSEKAKDRRYSDEWIGNVFRATLRGDRAP